ncbi:CPBP family intramembrane glutamic endopeptidase [Cytobacillus luteolus]|nr:CPBP family intramembrane glutamic endopeptidase [Cytobacillus luteolus]
MSFLIMYLILTSYFQLLPSIFTMSDVVRFFHLVLFFPLAYGLAKVVLKTGFEGYGLVFFRGWHRNLFIGLAIGFIGWVCLFTLQFMIGRYEYIGIKPVGDVIVMLVIIIVGFGLGSLINDMIVRGLVFHHFMGKLPVGVVMLISITLYALDDAWLEGLTLQNTIFSVVLGLSLTYAFYKTKSIWANTGIHLGLNIVYGLFFGVSGRSGDGVFIFNDNQISSLLSSWLSTIIAFMLFIIVIAVFKSKNGVVLSKIPIEKG